MKGTYGPFEVKVEVKVPLWFAISLKQKQKCSIKIPDWLSVAYLQDKVAEEKISPSFQDVDFHYIEIALMLFDRYLLKLFL